MAGPWITCSPSLLFRQTATSRSRCGWRAVLRRRLHDWRGRRENLFACSTWWRIDAPAVDGFLDRLGVVSRREQPAVPSGGVQGTPAAGCCNDHLLFRHVDRLDLSRHMLDADRIEHLAERDRDRAQVAFV